MKYKRFFASAIPFWLLAGIALSSCTAEKDPVPSLSSPLIELNANLDGQILNWDIGRNGWEMLPELREDSAGVVLYSCQIRNTEDPSLGKFEVILSQPTQSLLPNDDPSTVFSPGLRPFYQDMNQAGAGHSWYFEVDRPHKPGMTYKWTLTESLFGGTSVTVISGGEEMRKLNYTFQEPGNFPVRLTAFMPNGTDSATYADTISVGLGCHVDFSYQLIPGSQTFSLHMISDVQSPETALWIADQSDIQPVAAQINFPFFDNDIHKMLLYVQSAGCGDKTQFKLLSADPDANITSFHSFDSTAHFPQAGSVVIRYTDPQGKVFSSDALDQPSQSAFQILQSAPFSEENLYSTQVRIKAFLKNGTETKWLEVDDAKLVFRYK